jgi:hypothetical protein
MGVGVDMMIWPLGKGRPGGFFMPREDRPHS